MSRAMRLTPKTLPVIAKELHMVDDHIDHLKTALNTPATYYVVTDYKQDGYDISWVLLPDFTFDEKFRFGSRESDRGFISLIER